ncbi:hypothetical protein [Brachybacterium sp. YJGR34]|uniref:hypothetical protein n=1 Tax=Brachybacterium sp. YJGR34 TaxID=2059911 RepID=UPI0013006B5C|nr:hypothetical protein [Brachybacterium sp. YJGR34]
MTFDEVGPLQVLAVGFGPVADFTGEIVAELEALVAGGTIRVIDMRFLSRVDEETVVDLDLYDMDEEDAVEIGSVIDALRAAAGATETASGGELGIGAREIEQIAQEIPVGESVGILLFEHSWATRLKAAVRGVGGEMIAQGLLTPEAALIVGEEVAAIAEAEASIEIAEAVTGAALLDATAAVAEAEDIKAAAAIDTLRTLIAAEIVSDTAVVDALGSIVDAELISAAAIEAAAGEVADRARETDEALDALAEADGPESTS